MVMTRAAHIAFKPEHKVALLCLSSNGQFVSWADQSGLVSLATVSEDQTLDVKGIWHSSGTVVGLCLRGQRAYVLDDVEGLSCVNREGEVDWHVPVAGGGFSLHKGPTDMAVIDALGRLLRIGYDGSATDLTSQFEGILDAMYAREFLVLSHEDGSVKALKGSQVVWDRPVRGEVGESITALGMDASGHLIIGREGYALVDGEEEALEMETWCLDGQGLLFRCDLKTRLTHITPGLGSVVCGFDNGSVTHYKDNEHQELLNTGFAVQSLMVRQNHVVVSSWFYLLGVEAGSEPWKIEHQGMPMLLEASNDGSVCFFAGEDQNDWTEPEPIGFFSLESEARDADPSELTEWFQKPDAEPERSAEEIYRIDDSVGNLLTEEERILMEKPPEVGLDSLHAALDDFTFASPEDEAQGTLNVDAESLLEELDDQLSSMAMMPDEDLFDALNEEVVAPIAPIPKAGDDRVVTCDEDGTAVVLLDGLGSEDLQNRIVMWSWVDSTGKEIATQARAKVRLSAGVHRFELRICDSEGQWSSDTIQLTLKQA
jgi:hypothetical protein